MTDDDWLAGQFEGQRTRLRAVAYRMLGSISEADDAVQEAWLRVSRAGVDGVDNLAGWLTTVVARVSLNLLKARDRRREESIELRVPDPILSPESGVDPEQQAVLADSVGLALMVVLETLTPAERVAFVLHDLFAVSFDDIAPLLDRTPAATRQLASRARRRVQGQAPVGDPETVRQRAAVDAFLAAARDGDFDALVAVLDPDVVLRADGGRARERFTMTISGARTVASQAQLAQKLAPFARPVLINGAAGVITIAGDRVLSIMAFTVVHDKIATIDVLYDPDRLEKLKIPRLPPTESTDTGGISR
ncbi:sigma-70 family RNA polymerase sigma factor [Microlunatus speluncae]|uniref:sigma-70 family RNA polymerase sigma factor n=1 Tax=Microlunatus speluncae TaxID=2594267 RepID=UPI0012664467|nr:sigma-70 family RNA polymerase sigma factor [Microlunatus speluncae]